MRHVLCRLSLLLAGWELLLVGEVVCAQEPIIWKAPAMNGWRDTDTVEIHGVMADGQFQPDSIAVPQPSGLVTPGLIPLGQNILPIAQARPFGIEERVTLQQSGHTLHIACRPGRVPAGIVLHWPDFRLPASYRGIWVLSGATEVTIGVSSITGSEDAPAEPAARSSGEAFSIPLIEQKDQAIVLTCPEVGGSARVESVALLPDGIAAGARSRGSWVWREEDWRPNIAAFVHAASNAGFTELAIQVPAMPDAALAQLGHALSDKGIALRLLDGDPAMATPEGLARASARIAQLRRWCESHWDGKCPILELDIEPYGQAGFAGDPAKIWGTWAKAVNDLASIWGSPVAVDLPWWMQQSAAGETALQSVRGSLTEIVVMAYRTDPQLILDAVEPWFATARVPVQVAIETGPIPIEVTRTYRRAARGTLRISRTGVRLLAAPEAAGTGTDEALFELERETLTDPARVSFRGAAERAREVEHILTPLLHGWQNFGGFRIHGWVSSTGDTCVEHGLLPLKPRHQPIDCTLEDIARR